MAMFPGNIGDTPMLAHLNKPQKRALILRDQLRYLEPHHLDTFLNGITSDEPPTYKNVDGTVWPPLAQITIKEDATRFDLGNVQFPEEGGKTYHAYLTVEDERFEMRTEDALPKDDAELASVTIHRFVAENMFPLFKTKYKAIHARMEKMNEARRVAYNMLDHPPAKFEEGETLARLHSTKPKPTDDPLQDSNPRKRRQIIKHVSNKRPRIGLDSIPDTLKSETFTTLPARLKIDLFDTIITTAFPNFDNLLLASWNVVSVYANVGSDFPELHKAVVELKMALEEFEGTGLQAKGKGRARRDGTPGVFGAGRGGTPGVGDARGAVSARAKGVGLRKPETYREDKDEGIQMPPPPPRTIHSRQLHSHNNRHEDNDADADDAKPKHHASPFHRASTPLHTLKNQTPTPKPLARSTPMRSNRSTPTPASRSTPAPTPTSISTLTPTSKPMSTLRPSSSHTSTDSTPGSSLLRKRQEYASSISQANNRSSGAAMLRARHEHHDTEREDEEGVYGGDGDGGGDGGDECLSHRGEGLEGLVRDGAALQSSEAAGGTGGSGATSLGSAPVAPMVHVWRGEGVRRTA